MNPLRLVYLVGLLTILLIQGSLGDEFIDKKIDSLHNPVHAFSDCLVNENKRIFDVLPPLERFAASKSFGSLDHDTQKKLIAELEKLKLRAWLVRQLLESYGVYQTEDAQK